MNANDCVAAFFPNEKAGEFAGPFEFQIKYSNP
jgi:hypothetical protein